jgi:hypothetical protein
MKMFNTLGLTPRKPFEGTKQPKSIIKKVAEKA